MTTKKLSYLAVAYFAAVSLFTVLSVSLNFDISILSFFICAMYSAVIGYFCGYKLFLKNGFSFIRLYRILLQYGPYVLLTAFVIRRSGEFGVSYYLDLVSVVLWFLSFVLSLVILFFINPKRIRKINEDWYRCYSDHSIKLQFGLKRVGLEVLSWVDAIVQSVFMVLLINIFFVQLYEIPSESMVPEFLIKDRVLVFKTFSGPKFPLSDVGLPYVNKYERGDIVVFRNPHYEHDRKSEVRNFMSQLVYMCTLTSVNLNVDDAGNPIADPLVKRVVGVPGEQLMMQDGVLYSRREGELGFKPVEEDASWAAWNLYEDANPSVKDGIMVRNVIWRYPESAEGNDRSQQYINADAYNWMVSFEKTRRERAVEDLQASIDLLLEKFNLNYEIFMKNKTENAEQFDVDQLDMLYPIGYKLDSFENLLNSANCQEWIVGFMTEWKNHYDKNAPVYEEANFKLNLMIKECFVKMLNEYMATGKVSKDSSRYSMEINSYLQIMDSRNMPVFPANNADGTPVYIPDNCYFMMGDNRFNSLDMRHSYEFKKVPLAPADPYSVSYYSNMSPQYVFQDKILGTTSYRFWPLDRKGVPGHTGK